MYKIHHELDESYKDLAKTCRKNVRKLTGIYALGIVALFVILIAVNNMMLLAVLLMFYLFAFNLVLRYRAVSLLPITKLLYEDCNYLLLHKFKGTYTIVPAHIACTMLDLFK